MPLHNLEMFFMHLLRCTMVFRGSLSHWKVKPCFSFTDFTHGRFLPKVSQRLVPLNISLIWISRPVPFQEKLSQSIMFPLTYFAVSMMFLGCNPAFFPLQTWQVKTKQFHFAPFDKLQIALHMCLVKQWDLQSAAGFYSMTMQCSVILMESFIIMVSQYL